MAQRGELELDRARARLVEAKPQRLRGRLLEGERETALERLRAECAQTTEPDRGGEHAGREAAQLEQNRVLRGDAERPRKRAVDDGEVSVALAGVDGGRERERRLPVCEPGRERREPAAAGGRRPTSRPA